MRKQWITRVLTIVAVAALVSFMAVPSGAAQEAPREGQRGQAAKPMPPIPRLSDGTPSLGWEDPQDKGVWKTAERHWDLALRSSTEKKKAFHTNPGPKPSMTTASNRRARMILKGFVFHRAAHPRQQTGLAVPGSLFSCQNRNVSSGSSKPEPTSGKPSTWMGVLIHQTFMTFRHGWVIRSDTGKGRRWSSILSASTKDIGHLPSAVLTSQHHVIERFTQNQLQHDEIRSDDRRSGGVHKTLEDRV